MWTNPRTGKGWTHAEEKTFAEIMRVGRMERIKAIQLFRRSKSDPAKALKLAAEYGAAAVAAQVGIEARREGLRRYRELHRGAPWSEVTQVHSEAHV